MGFVVFALLAAAPPGREDRETVQVSVIAILATDQDDKIDPKLACIAREVRKTHKELTGFRMGKIAKKSLVVGVKQTFDLGGDQKAVLTVKQAADSKNRVEVTIEPPQMGEITYDTCCGKFLPIVTPIRTKNNDLLLIAVRVQPCHEK